MKGKVLKEMTLTLHDLEVKMIDYVRILDVLSICPHRRLNSFVSINITNDLYIELY